MDRRAKTRGALTGEPGDAGLFGPDSEAWRLDREAMLLLGAGPRALLLQVAHPSVAAGVAEHSDFRTDPWRRLDATTRSILTIVYGPGHLARGEIRRLNEFHRSIVGPGYSARDPDLSLWVHATLIDSALAAYDAWLEPLSRIRRARFYEESKPLGLAFGIPRNLLPGDLDAFEEYLARMLGSDGPVHPSGVAIDLADTILRPPLGPLAGFLPAAVAPVVRPLLDAIPAAAYAWTMLPAIGLLPPSVRAAFGLTWGLPERAVSAWLVAGWRAWRPLIPTRWRWMPQARAADRRVGRNRTVGA